MICYERGKNMTTDIEIYQEVSICIDWEKLSRDIRKEFNITNSEKDIEIFLTSNEKKYLKSDVYGSEFTAKYTNDRTGEELEDEI
jgi:hypothetical protein